MALNSTFERRLDILNKQWGARVSEDMYRWRDALIEVNDTLFFCQGMMEDYRLDEKKHPEILIKLVELVLSRTPRKPTTAPTEERPR